MNEDFDEDMKRIVAESQKLLCRPWEEVQKEIQKRQILGSMPKGIGVESPNLPSSLPEKLGPAKPHI